MRRIFILTILAALAHGTLLAEAPRVAVAHFDYATVRNFVVEILGSDVDLGKGIADMLEAQLAGSGKYRVYERRRLGVVLGEQDDSNSARFDPRTAVRIGELTGAEYVLLGSITRFGRDDARKGVNVGGFLGRWVPTGDLRIGEGEAKAVVGLTLKLVNARTGEIITPAEAVGNSKRKSKSLGGLASLGGKSLWGQTEMTAENFGQTILGEAAAEAVQLLVGKLTDPAVTARLVARPPAEIKVAKIANGSVYLAAGDTAGLKPNDVIEIHRIEEVIPDPDDPAKTLDVVTTVVAEAAVIEVKERVTIAKLNSQVAATPEQRFLAKRRQ